MNKPFYTPNKDLGRIVGLNKNSPSSLVRDFAYFAERKGSRYTHVRIIGEFIPNLSGRLFLVESTDHMGEKHTQKLSECFLNIGSN